MSRAVTGGTGVNGLSAKCTLYMFTLQEKEKSKLKINVLVSTIQKTLSLKKQSNITEILFFGNESSFFNTLGINY